MTYYRKCIAEPYLVILEAALPSHQGMKIWKRYPRAPSANGELDKSPFLQSPQVLEERCCWRHAAPATTWAPRLLVCDCDSRPTSSCPVWVHQLDLSKPSLFPAHSCAGCHCQIISLFGSCSERSGAERAGLQHRHRCGAHLRRTHTELSEEVRTVAEGKIK